jgi:enterochelin esterase-like enzyme
MQEGKVRDTIVVGIPNNGKYRYSEYYPDKMLALAPAAVREDYQRRAQWGFTLADAYLKFVALELKPAIDARFSTRADRANTVVMGSSMGGLISLYTLCEYPEVFGAAAGLSTHWVGRPGAWGYPDKVQNASMPLAAFTYLQTHLPKAGLHRIYTDHGTTALDSLYGVHQDFADQLFKDKGYAGDLFISRVFEGTGHSENDWAARVDIPLLFLLGLPAKSEP